MTSQNQIPPEQAAPAGGMAVEPEGDRPSPLERLTASVRLEWVALATVWLGSIAINEAVGGHGVGVLDLVMAVDRGLLGLLICFVLIPRFLGKGRNLAFLGWAAASIGIFTFIQIGLIQPAMMRAGLPSTDCFRCYLALNLPAAASMAVVSLSWSVLEQQKKAAVAARERSDAELRFLRAQMNPHLLFNSLNNVYSYALERSERAPEMILKLSSVLRYMIYETGDGRVPLSQELQYLTDYFELQMLTTEGRGQTSLLIKSDGGDYSIAPLILVVLIENCFKHAVDTVQPIQVEVAITVSAGILTLTTSNNLPAGRTDGEAQPGGIGLTNVRRRLELLYPARFTLETGAAGDLYRASLTLHLDAP
ncbi:MAG: sensor histidine kinase [Brevundimonas sp.]